MDREIRVGAVSYLNTKPLLYGIQQHPVIDKLRLTIDYPSRIAASLLNGEIDLGLVPVAIIPRMQESHIYTQYCIGSDGPVASVCLFSETPIDQIKKIILDYQSRTSVELVKILCKEYWKISPEWEEGREDFRRQIHGTTAGVVIGDRALEQRKISPYIYDLGEAWKNLTGLPFVYAAWISNKELDPEFLQTFNDANAYGLEHLSSVLAGLPNHLFDLHDYYTKFISYRLDEAKRKGLQLFLQKMGKY